LVIFFFALFLIIRYLLLGTRRGEKNILCAKKYVYFSLSQGDKERRRSEVGGRRKRGGERRGGEEREPVAHREVLPAQTKKYKNNNKINKINTIQFFNKRTQKKNNK